MPWETDLETVIARTGAGHLRAMCSPDFHDHLRMRERVSLMAHPEANMPPIHVQAGNALGAIGRVIGAAVTGQAVWVPSEVLDARRSECAICPHLVNNRCKLCGCPYERKIRLATERCPDKPPRWGAYKEEEMVNHETLD
jgi:hypothetical protein